MIRAVPCLLVGRHQSDAVSLAYRFYGVKSRVSLHKTRNPSITVLDKAVVDREPFLISITSSPRHHHHLPHRRQE
ncbi:hypothetical protein CEXT_217491 [Caerostris extrusa]|uniref:Uncharacterized protein n=1 Tax=Caerostris extrusa TaxID=172846 RepID=A0AAV4XNN9_CAEEX|nr:hypothetical protein CEXT_217491 [Caerostris extrusa]